MEESPNRERRAKSENKNGTHTVAVEQILAISSAPLARPREIAQELDDLSHMVVVLGIPALFRFRGEQEIGGEQLEQL